MKTLYTFGWTLVVMMALAVTMTSCSSDLSYQEAINKNDRKIEDPEKQADARFLVETKSYNLLQMQVAELAKTKGYAASVVKFASKQLKDFTELDEDLHKLARNERIVLPTSMNDEHQARYYEISKASREDFDRMYMTIEKTVHEQTKQKFLSMATDARDPDIRAFAARKLDVMRSHEQLVADIDKDLLDTY